MKSEKNEKSLTFANFRENFGFWKIFAKNCCFRDSFREKFPFFENFQYMFRIWIHIQVAPEAGSAFQTENFREKCRETEKFRKNENFRENEKFAKTFAKTKIFVSC
jgi:hypothetical protein